MKIMGTLASKNHSGFPAPRKQQGRHTTYRCGNPAIAPEDYADFLTLLAQRKSLDTELRGNNWQSAFMPPTQTSLEFELMMRHPVAYPILLPVDTALLDVELLFKPRGHNLTQIQEPKQFSLIQSPASKSANSEGLCDDRLQSLDIHIWTRVPITNDFAARLISTFLEKEYFYFGVFDADLFISSLTSNTRYFCSPLLVSAVLSFSCLSFIDLEPTVSMHNLSRAFFDEAQACWLSIQNIPSLTSIAALTILGALGLIVGLPETAEEYYNNARVMGQQMGLWGVQAESDSAKSWLGCEKDWIRAASCTAWKAFIFYTEITFHYRSGFIEYPPLLPIPGTGTYTAGEFVFPVPQPKFVDRFNPFNCTFHLLMHELIWTYYDRGEASRSPTIQQAETLYRKTLAWCDGLPLDLARGYESEREIIFAHMVIHGFICAIFQPFVQETRKPLRLQTFASPHSSALAAYTASANQFKRLSVTYRTAFECDNNTAMMNATWVKLIPIVCRRIPEQATEQQRAESRFYYFVCLMGLCNMIIPYRAMGISARGMLSLALNNGVISAKEVAQVSRRLKKLDSWHTWLDVGQIAKATYIINPDLAEQDLLAARVDTIGEQLAMMSPMDDAGDDIPDEIMADHASQVSSLGHYVE